MSAINGSNNQCLLIYTNVEDNMFNTERLEEHEEFLRQVYTVDTIRSGTIEHAYQEAVHLKRQFHLIEIAAHGHQRGIDLGEDQVIVNGPHEETLKKLINMLDDHGVIILQSCRTGAPQDGAPCFAEYIAHLASRTVRVIANTGYQFGFEFRSLYPVSVRFTHNGCDQTACIQKRPDGEVLRIHTETLDHFQRKLRESTDLEIAHQIAAGFGEEELINRLSQVGNALEETLFSDTEWFHLFQDQPQLIKQNLLKLAALNRYGTLISHLDQQTRDQALIALVGSPLELDYSYSHLTGYLRCCFEVEGKVPPFLHDENFSVALEACIDYYRHHLLNILENFTIDRCFVADTEWENILERLNRYKHELHGDDSSEIFIAPEDKDGRISIENNAVSFGFKTSCPFFHIGRNILALAAAERFKEIFIFLDNGRLLHENPAGMSFVRLTGMIAHPAELPFKRALEGVSSVPNSVKQSFRNLKRGSIDEYRFFQNGLDCTCLNQLCTSISEFWKKTNEAKSYQTMQDFITQAVLAFQSSILEKLKLRDIPREYSEAGYSDYHRLAVVENFLEFVPFHFDLDNLPFEYRVRQAKELATETLGLYSQEELETQLKTAKLRLYLLGANIPEYRKMWRGIYQNLKLNVNQPIGSADTFTYPLHIAAKHEDQKLITLLMELGAIVDLTDHLGNVARQYALDQSFIPSDSRSQLSVLETPNVTPIIRDYLRLRIATGSWNVKIQIGQGPRQTLLQYTWEHFLHYGTEQEKIAAKMVFERLAFDGKTPGTYEHFGGSKQKMNQLLSKTHVCIRKFSSVIDQFQRRNNRTPSFIECLKWDPWLLNFWLPLTNLLKSSHLTTEESTHILYLSGKHQIAVQELLFEVKTGRMPYSLLFLYPLLNKNPNYLEVIAKQNHRLSKNGLAYVIARTFYRLAVLHENHRPFVEEMSKQITQYIFSDLSMGTEAVATFLTIEKYSTSMKCSPKDLLRRQLSRNQILSLFVRGKTRQLMPCYFKKLLECDFHTDSLTISDERLFMILPGCTPFEEAYLQWLDSMEEDERNTFFKVNEAIFANTTNGLNLEAKKRFFSEILKDRK